MSYGLPPIPTSKLDNALNEVARHYNLKRRDLDQLLEPYAPVPYGTIFLDADGLAWLKLKTTRPDDCQFLWFAETKVVPPHLDGDLDPVTRDQQLLRESSLRRPFRALLSLDLQNAKGTAR